MESGSLVADHHVKGRSVVVEAEEGVACGRQPERLDDAGLAGRVLGNGADSRLLRPPRWHGCDRRPCGFDAGYRPALR